MLAVVPIGESNQQWLGVGDLMRQEAHEEVERRLDHYTARAKNLAGVEPERVVREGMQTEEVLKVIEEDEDIAILVLAAASGTDEEWAAFEQRFLSGDEAAYQAAVKEWTEEQA